MWRSAASNIISLLVAVLLLAGGIGITAKSLYSSGGPLETAICVRIPVGSSFSVISEELKKKAHYNQLGFLGLVSVIRTKILS